MTKQNREVGKSEACMVSPNWVFELFELKETAPLAARVLNRLLNTLLQLKSKYPKRVDYWLEIAVVEVIESGGSIQQSNKALHRLRRDNLIYFRRMNSDANESLVLKIVGFRPVFFEKKEWLKTGFSHDACN